MSLYKRKDKIWQYDKVVDGRRITISGRVRDKRAAWKIIRTKLEGMPLPKHQDPTAVVALDAGAGSALPGAGTVSLGMVRDDYIAAAPEKFKSPHNFNRHRNYMNWLVERLGSHRDLFSITHHDLLPIVRELGGGQKPRKAATINARVLNVMRPLFRYALLTLGIPGMCRVDWRLVARPGDNTRVRYLKKDEMARLLSAAPDRDGSMHQFAWITGFRVTEVINLRWSDIDWDHRLVTTRVKGGRLHSVPLTKRLEHLLKNLRPGSHPEYVFSFECKLTNRRRRQIKGLRYKFSYGHLYDRLRATIDEAGIENYRFHDHRHTAATLVLLATGSIRLVQALLGHRDIQSCERYAHLDVSVLARELERMDERDLPHVAMAEALTSAGMMPADPLRMDDVYRENIRLLRQMAQLADENRALRQALADAVV